MHREAKKKVIIVTYPEAIVESVDRSSLKKQSIVFKEEEVDLDF